MPETTAQFATRIRAKFPGAYDGVADDDLVGRWVKKYPDYAGWAQDTSPGPAPGPVSSLQDVTPQRVQTPTLARLGLTADDVKAGKGPQPATWGEKAASLGIDAVTGIGDALGGVVGAAADLGTLPSRAEKWLLTGRLPTRDELMPMTSLASRASDDLRSTARMATGLTDTSETAAGPVVRFASTILTPIPTVRGAGIAAREAVATTELARVPLFKNAAAQARQLEVLVEKFPSAQITKKGTEYVVRGKLPRLPLVESSPAAASAVPATSPAEEILGSGKLFKGEAARTRQLDALADKYPDAEVRTTGDTFEVVARPKQSAASMAPPAEPVPAARLPIEAPAEIPTEAPATGTGPSLHVDPGGFPVSSERAKRIALEIPGAMRSLSTSFDVSAPFRQGVFLVGNKRFWQSMGPMFRSLASKDAYEAVQAEIAARPSYDLMKRSKLALTDLGEGLTDREEQFKSTWAEKVPGVKQSEQAFTAYTNKLRADVFDDLARKSERLGLPLEDDAGELTKQALDISKFVNAATGRGNLPEMLAHSQNVINAVFFSPRLISSRMTLMNPFYYATLPPVVRQEAIKSALTFAGFGTLLMGLAKLAGADVSMNPTNSDFMKMRFGKVRIDPWGGFQQYAVLASRLLAQKTTTTSGKTKKIGEGGRYGVTNADVVGKFIENKLAPFTSLAWAMLKTGTDKKTGKRVDQYGQPVEVSTEMAKRFVPMVAQDIYEVWRADPRLVPVAGPASALGMGVQTFDSAPGKKTSKSTSDVDTEAYIKNSARLPPVSGTTETTVTTPHGSGAVTHTFTNKRTGTLMHRVVLPGGKTTVVPAPAGRE